MTIAIIRSGEIDWTPIIEIADVAKEDWQPPVPENPEDRVDLTAIDLTPYPETVDASCEYHPLQGVFRAADGAILREPPPTVPHAPIAPLTPLQLRSWLLVRRGLDDNAVATLIDASQLSTQEKALAHIAWQYALQFERRHPFIEAISRLMTPPMTAIEVDAAFTEASKELYI